MAARDRNLFAWQAYVIAMSFVVVILLVALGYTIYSSSNTEKSRASAVEQSNTARNEVRKLSEQIQYVGGVLGQKQFTEAEWKQLKETAVADQQFQTIQAQFEKDMSLFGPSEPIQNKNYPKLAEYLMRELRARNGQVEAAAKAYAELTLKTESTVKTETAAREAAEKKSADMEKMLETERANFQQKLDEDQKAITEVNKTLQESIAKFKEMKDSLTAAYNKEKARASKLESLNLDLAERIRVLEGETFQTAQGKIIDVMDGGKIVWVNLGSADKLRPGVRFGIVNPDEQRLEDARPKAHVEITKITSEHQAQGQVILGSLQVPVVKGDLVLSKTWQKGRPVKFALMGKLDMNNDGIDDRQIIKELIIQSGGEISEDLMPDGTSTRDLAGPQKKEMTADTRWLVVGEGFELTGADETDPSRKNFRQKYADMQRRARELAVSQLNLDKLLNWIQSSNNNVDRTVPLGAAARPSDTSDRRRVPSSTGTVSEVFMNPKQTGPYAPARTTGDKAP